MRVVAFDRYGPPDMLREAERPVPIPGPGEVRLRVRAAGTNPADVKWRQGMFHGFAPLRFPHVPGYDVAGEVDAIGPGAGAFALGDRAFAMLDNRTMGGYAEHAVLPAADCAPMPDALDFPTAAALPTAALTGVQMIDDHVRPEAGEWLAIIGATGAVGRFALLAARRRGARVVAVVRAAHAREAERLGAGEVVVLDDGAGPDAAVAHVVDTVGGDAVARLCRRLRPAGRIVTVATAPINPEGLSSAPEFLTVRMDGGQLAAIGRDVAAGAIPVPIARRMPLAAAADAHRLIEAGGNGGKIILEP